MEVVCTANDVMLEELSPRACAWITSGVLPDLGKECRAATLDFQRSQGMTEPQPNAVWWCVGIASPGWSGGAVPELTAHPSGNDPAFPTDHRDN